MGPLVSSLSRHKLSHRTHVWVNNRWTLYRAAKTASIGFQYCVPTTPPPSTLSSIVSTLDSRQPKVFSEIHFKGNVKSIPAYLSLHAMSTRLKGDLSSVSQESDLTLGRTLLVISFFVNMMPKWWINTASGHVYITQHKHLCFFYLNKQCSSGDILLRSSSWTTVSVDTVLSSRPGMHLFSGHLWSREDKKRDLMLSRHSLMNRGIIRWFRPLCNNSKIDAKPCVSNNQWALPLNLFMTYIHLIGGWTCFSGPV
jgi:hypothetical protein